ncbi:MAG: MmcQ/YjbR family DNA-binding protein [Gammaproteobacteria bacterium]|nr:MmcQ/YjbR family DNA-binding protein [Gammaproteobacteria bacterium]
MPKTVSDAVREVCLSFPQSEEFLSHGKPNFRVRRGKVYAIYAVNHHGDGRVALWLKAAPGAQDHHVKASPNHFFVPPYVGPSGWLGVRLDRKLSWKRIAALVREAYEQVAPARLVTQIGKTLDIEPPRKAVPDEQFDPMTSARAQRLLAGVRKICGAWPEAREARQFGVPVWRAGKRTFVWAYADEAGLKLSFWVGVERQGLMCADRRFTIPRFLGHNGWIALDVAGRCDWDEVRALALDSYRHFALKRMLRALEDSSARVRAAADAHWGESVRFA